MDLPTSLRAASADGGGGMGSPEHRASRCPVLVMSESQTTAGDKAHVPDQQEAT